MATHVLTIRGMTCDHCVRTLSGALRAVPGVREAQVDLLTRTARVEHDEAGGVGELFSAVQRAGFQVDGFQAVDSPQR